MSDDLIAETSIGLWGYLNGLPEPTITDTILNEVARLKNEAYVRGIPTPGNHWEIRIPPGMMQVFQEKVMPILDNLHSVMRFEIVPDESIKEVEAESGIFNTHIEVRPVLKKEDNEPRC